MPIYTFDATDDESGGSYELVLRAVDLPQARHFARARGATPSAGSGAWYSMRQRRWG